MVDFKKCKIEDIIEDAKKNKRIDELKKMIVVEKPLKNKKGEDRKLSYIELKRAYYDKFYEEMIPVGKNPAKKKDFLKMIEDL